MEAAAFTACDCFFALFVIQLLYRNKATGKLNHLGRWMQKRPHCGAEEDHCDKNFQAKGLHPDESPESRIFQHRRCNPAQGESFRSNKRSAQRFLCALSSL